MVIDAGEAVTVVLGRLNKLPAGPLPEPVAHQPAVNLRMYQRAALSRPSRTE